MYQQVAPVEIYVKNQPTNKQQQQQQQQQQQKLICSQQTTTYSFVSVSMLIISFIARDTMVT